MKKVICLVLSLCMLCTLFLCSASAEGKIRIGMVSDIDGINDRSFCQSCWEGLLILEEEDDSFEMNYRESRYEGEFGPNIQYFIDEGYDLVLCVGYAMADALRTAAEAHPEQRFAIIDDASCADLPNVACLMFAQEEASYLAGLVAGSVTQSKIVGYVQGMVSDTMNLFGAGYLAGVLDACPDATLLQYNFASFDDPTDGAVVARDMIAKGADIIFHAAGATGLGVISACGQEGIWAIGVDTDQSILDPDHVITSAVKRVDVAAQSISRAVKDGAFVSGVYLYNLSNGGVDLAATHDHIPPEVLEKVEAAKAAIIAGERVVPTTSAGFPVLLLNKD